MSCFYVGWLLVGSRRNGFIFVVFHPEPANSQPT